ncbi:MAG: TOBE domain-containing protein, partial [Steroidobacteraceae bacterium]
HDQEEAMSVSDLVIVMSGGDIVSMAPPRQIFDRPDSVYVASFVGGSNLLDATVIERHGEDVIVRLENGSVVTGFGNQALSSGDKAVVAIKPCDVLARPQSDVGPNVVDGQISSTTFLGGHIELCLSLCGSREFRVPIPRDSEAAVGDRIRLFFPPERVSILAPDRIDGPKRPV